MKRLSYYIYVCVGMCLLPFMSVNAASDDATVNKLEKNYILHADGSQEMRVRKEVTLYTHPAINTLYGETFIVYNPDYQELKIHESYTRQQDGTIIQTPENAFVECLPRAAADAPAYNELKEMVIVHTGLELGATICLDYSVITRAGYLPELDLCVTVEEVSPIREYLLSVTVPESKPLHYALVNGTATPEVKVENGNQILTLNLQDVPACPYLSEPNAALAGNVQVLLANTYASVEDALSVLNNQFAAAGEEEVKTLSQKLGAGKSADEMEKAYKEYVNGLGNCRLSLEETGYHLRPATEVIRTAYGTDAEKLNLLAGLKQAAGLSAEVKAGYGVNAENNCLGLSAITKLFLNSPEVADLQDFQPVKMLNGKEVVLDTPQPIHRIDTLTLLPEMGQELPGGYRVVTLPHPRENHIGVGNSTRTANLLLPCKVDETDTYIVNLPSDMQLNTSQGTRKVSNAVGTWELTVTAGDNQVEVVHSLKLNKQLITPDDYADYRSLIAELEDVNNTTLLLKSK